jgi:hypothetical protein
LRQPLNSFTYTGLQLEGEFEEILADELNVKSVKLGEVQEFDLNLTAELKQEGLARELERAVQEMRKQKGLKVGEAADLSYDTNDSELIAAFAVFDTKKTYISSIKQQALANAQAVEIDGKQVAIELT